MQASVYIPTASRLQHPVTRVWETAGTGTAHDTILPQGTFEIIFNFAGETKMFSEPGRQITTAPRCFIQGMYTQAFTVQFTGGYHLLGVCLQPSYVQRLLRLLPGELHNRALDLTLINPVFNALWHRLQELGSFDERRALLEATFPVPRDKGCDRSGALSQLFLSGGTAVFQTVDELARRVCYSTRQLNRVVQDLYGISAEELTTYKKFMESVRLIHAEEDSLTRVAYGAGFYDQAHFCRTFKSFTNLTPGQYRKQKGFQPFHIFS
jgi:AraC-like DNA-binding protein